MTNGDAFKIFNDINSEEYSDVEKAAAIYTIIQMPTPAQHNSIGKDELIEVIKYLWNGLYFLEAEGTEEWK